jgi:hypothetical protein
MWKSVEIIAASPDTSATDSYETLQAEMVDLLTGFADRIDHRNNKRSGLIMRKMAATIATVPYGMLVELGHSYSSTLICYALLLHVVRADAPDYADARDLVGVLLDELRSIDLDDPDTQKAIEKIEVIIKPEQRPAG